MADENTWNQMVKKKKDTPWYEPEPGGSFDRFMNPNEAQAQSLTPEQKKAMKQSMIDAANGK